VITGSAQRVLRPASIVYNFDVMKKQPEQSGAVVTGFRAIIVVGGLIALGLGWSAQSQGILWHSGRNARLGTETSTPTFSWMIYGVIMILAGLFPWNWLSRHLKR